MSLTAPGRAPTGQAGRYVLFSKIASGGMAEVFIGQLRGEEGFARTVAIKRPLAHLAGDRELLDMFFDEARIASRIHHPNVVSTLDIVREGEAVHVVMEYVAGAPLTALCKEPIPVAVAVAIMIDVLRGLDAAHEARSERGEPLGIVHRDVSPHNVLVGSDGIGRVLDFGVAKATTRAVATRDGTVKGKPQYMAPEQLLGKVVTKEADVFAAGAVLWELIVGRRLFATGDPLQVLARILHEPIPTPSAAGAAVPDAVEEIVMRALDRAATKRFSTALEMAAQLQQATRVASAGEVAAFVRNRAGDELDRRAQLVEQMEALLAEGARASIPGLASALAGAGDSKTITDATEFFAGVIVETSTRKQRRGRSRSFVLAAVGSAVVIAVAAVAAARLAPKATRAAPSPTTAVAAPPPDDDPPLVDLPPASPLAAAPAAPGPSGTRVVPRGAPRPRAASPHTPAAAAPPPVNSVGPSPGPPADDPKSYR